MRLKIEKQKNCLGTNDLPIPCIFRPGELDNATAIYINGHTKYVSINDESPFCKYWNECFR